MKNDKIEVVYNGFNKHGNTFVAQQKQESSVPKLPSGVYEVAFDAKSGILLYNQIQTRSDGLIKLPSDEFTSVIDQIELFLQPKTKALFEEYNFLYKRSALLYGPPGTGKTCIVNQVAEHVKNSNGIVLFNPQPELVEHAINQINDVQPETTVLVIFEELDKILERNEAKLLTLLDGEVQKSNIIYMATTNFIDKIPPRIQRPGRFSTLVEVGYPSKAVRKHYLTVKLSDPSEINKWTELTEGFTIDELKETVLSVKCLAQKVEDVIERIRYARSDMTSDPIEDLDDEERDIWDDPVRLKRALRNR